MLELLVLAGLLGGAGYLWYKKQHEAPAPQGTTGTASASFTVPNYATDPNSAVPLGRSAPSGDSTLQGMIGAVQLNAAGGLVLTPANMNQLNTALTYMKQNRTSKATMPAAVATWMVNHAIDPSRTL